MRNSVNAQTFSFGHAAQLSEFETPKRVFGPAGNTIPELQAHGVVFMACHNAIWEMTGKLLANGMNPDRLSHEAVAAEMTNHLIEGVVLTPGIVATIPELQQTGFHYAKWAGPCQRTDFALL